MLVCPKKYFNGAFNFFEKRQTSNVGTRKKIERLLIPGININSMSIHQKFLVFAEAAIVEWVCTCTDWVDAYPENKKDEFHQENYDNFVSETFNVAHESWYDFSPQTLTIDDIQWLLTTHAEHCEHQKEHVGFIVPPPDSIHDLLVNYGYYKATVDVRDRLYARMVELTEEIVRLDRLGSTLVSGLPTQAAQTDKTV